MIPAIVLSALLIIVVIVTGNLRSKIRRLQAEYDALKVDLAELAKKKGGIENRFRSVLDVEAQIEHANNELKRTM